VKGACTPVCAANFAECGRPAPAPDDGCETDLTKPESCGACAHSCLGGTCTNKKCDPIYLASGRETPRAIVVDANYVHWVEGGTTNGAVLRMPRNGTAITQVASNQALPLDIATDGQFIYWCNALSGSTAIKIQEIGTIGNGTSLSVIDPSKLASPCPIAVNGGSIYWFDYNLRQTFYTSLEIGFVIALSPPVGYPSTELYVDSTNVYFAPGDAEYAPLDFSQSTTALSFPGSSGVSIAIDATYVYYTTGATSNGLARRAKNLSGTEQPIASSISGTISNAMTTDANFLYYAAGTTLYKVPKAGGTPVPLSTAVDGMVDIVANGDALYWVNRGDQNGGKTGSIVKLAL
jgi:hypothetical protein